MKLEKNILRRHGQEKKIWKSRSTKSHRGAQWEQGWKQDIGFHDQMMKMMSWKADDCKGAWKIDVDGIIC